MTLEWNAAEYEVLSGLQTGWGADLLGLYLQREPLRGDEKAIDAGCGTGRITELLLRHLPKGKVLAVDGSAAMVEATGWRFAGVPRVRVERADLLCLEVEEPVDLILSTATFHWIKDHERLFGNLARALKPGGQLVAQCGGVGNISRVRAVIEQVIDEARFKRHFVRWEDPWNFADPETTRAQLEAAGFQGVETWLHDEPTEFATEEETARFLRTSVLAQHLTFLPEKEHGAFAAAVAGRLAAAGSLVLDYVRLNILATRRASGVSGSNKEIERRDKATKERA